MCRPGEKKGTLCFSKQSLPSCSVSVQTQGRLIYHTSLSFCGISSGTGSYIYLYTSYIFIYKARIGKIIIIIIIESAGQMWMKAFFPPSLRVTDDRTSRGDVETLSWGTHVCVSLCVCFSCHCPDGVEATLINHVRGYIDTGGSIASVLCLYKCSADICSFVLKRRTINKTLTEQ